MLHIHSIVEECEIVELIEEIDMKKKKDADPKKKKPKRKPLFVKNGAVVVCRIQVIVLFHFHVMWASIQLFISNRWIFKSALLGE